MRKRAYMWVAVALALFVLMTLNSVPASACTTNGACDDNGGWCIDAKSCGGSAPVVCGICCCPSGECDYCGCGRGGPPCGGSSCTPKTCSSLGKECGSWGDGCGGTIKCGSCADTTETCNKGKCGKANGQTCTKDAECAYGFCVKGICCNKACTGGCERCDVTGAEGTCTLLSNLSCTIAPSGQIAWSCGGKTACCEFASCVDKSGRCGAVENYIMNLNSGGNDNIAACQNVDGTPKWLDCDTDSAYAICAPVCGGGTGVYAGETGVGEYADLTRKGCCGDDINEFYKAGSALIGGASEKCCNKASDCVGADGKCKDEGTFSAAEGLKCLDGAWRYPRLTWDGKKEGTCPEKTQCLVDPLGDSNLNNRPDMWYSSGQSINNSNTTIISKGPMCIADNQYIMDNLCAQGSWTTRTRALAGLFANDQAGWEGGYTIFCGNYTDALNYYSYLLNGIVNADQVLRANGLCGAYPCLNNFCVLLNADGSLRAVGSSLNPTKDYAFNMSVITISLNLSNVSCPNNPTRDAFDDCTSAGLKLNARSKMFVYMTPSKKDMVDGSNFMTRFTRLVKAPFDALFKAYIGANSKDSQATLYNFYAIPDFDRLYIMVKAGKSIFAVEESINMTDRLMMNYTGFSTDLCAMMLPTIPAGKGNCTSEDGSQVVFARKDFGEDSPVFGNWAGMTAGLRVS